MKKIYFNEDVIFQVNDPKNGKVEIDYIDRRTGKIFCTEHVRYTEVQQIMRENGVLN